MKLPAVRCLRLAGVLLILGAPCLARAQTPNTDSPQQPRPDLSTKTNQPQAAPSDVASIQDIVKAFYSAISAPAGGKLDRARLHSLFVPSGRIAVGLPPEGTHPANVIFLSLDQYADGSDAQTAKEGFFDANPANRVEQFGVMAHVYSTYESRARMEDPEPTARGVKSFELLQSAGRWYILQVYWDSERPGNPLPERYLHDDTH
ncbi:MAG: hypothetical protein INR62_06895 [Rhodospirillales bacterium]|nr:hypothetical protein [Acetobacter sp.]